MDLNQPSGATGGITTSISGLAAALLRHLLALAELASGELRLLIRQGITSLILLAALLLFVMVGYLTLVAMAVSLLVVGAGWNWPGALGATALFHLLCAVAIVFMLRFRTSRPLFEATAAELRHDMESLKSYSKQSTHQSL